MNTTQIKCFLALADTLNFTRAAARLYLSQPALSRQISTLEQEINTLLFIRDQKSVRLTPAGTLLAGELGSVYSALEQLIARVQTVSMGYTGTLTIGVLEGQWVGEQLPHQYLQFLQTYPNVELKLSQGSFGALRRELDSGQIDVAITLKLDITHAEDLVIRDYLPDRAVLAISRRRPLARKESVTLEDLAEETLLVIAPEDSSAGADRILNHLRSAAVTPKAVRYAPNFATLMLWIEAGLGAGVINHSSSLARDPAVRLLDEIPLEDASICAVWRKKNLNPAIALFDQMLDQFQRK